MPKIIPLPTTANPNLAIPEGIKPGDILLMQDASPVNWITRIQSKVEQLERFRNQIEHWLMEPQFYSHAALVSEVGPRPEDLKIIEAAGKAYSDETEAGVAERRFIDSRLFGANPNSPQIDFFRPKFPEPIREADQTLLDRLERRNLTLVDLGEALGPIFLPGSRSLSSLAWRWVLRQMTRDGGFTLENLKKSIEMRGEIEADEADRKGATIADCFDLDAIASVDAEKVTALFAALDETYHESKPSERGILTEDEARARVVEYARAQIGEPYFESPELFSKWMASKWYCSLLVFKAFSRSVEGMSLERYQEPFGSEFVVWPDDLFKSNRLEHYFRWWRGVSWNIGG